MSDKKSNVVSIVRTRIIPESSNQQNSQQDQEEKKEEKDSGMLGLFANLLDEGASIYEGFTGKNAKEIRKTVENIRKVQVAGTRANELKERVTHSNIPKIAKQIHENMEKKGVFSSKEYGK